jgi:hypothetical protein
VAAFSHKIDDRATVLTTLKMVEAKVSQFSSTKTTTKQNDNNRSVSLAFDRVRVRTLP